MSNRRHTEGEANTSAARARWRAREAHPATRALLDRDAAAFLHQSLSSPCVSTIAKAEGIWIEDTAGRRFMDFHGNSVHHIGYGHPRVTAAIKAQVDALPFSPRRFTNEVATRLAERLGENGIAVKRYKKPTVTRPAPLDLQQQIALEANIVVEGLAD